MNRILHASNAAPRLDGRDTFLEKTLPPTRPNKCLLSRFLEQWVHLKLRFEPVFPGIQVVGGYGRRTLSFWSLLSLRLH